MATDIKLEHIQLLDMLSETFGESEGQSPDEIRKELREEGLDIDSVESELMYFRQEISMAARSSALDEAKNEREKLLARKKEIMDKIKHWTKEQIRERLEEILKAEPDAAVAYRNLETDKEEDLKTILADIELARLTEKEYKNDNE